jgi:L-ribulokinase
MGERLKVYSLGFDFGTESVRALLLDVVAGQIIATAQRAYPHGVIDRKLPGSQNVLPPDWALQDPSDWLEAMEVTALEVLKQGAIDPESVIGIGVDCTACTILPTTADGTPLAFIDEYLGEPHAWPKLWKHHAAWPQCERINRFATERQEPWLKRYGGAICSEWVMPKALQMLEESARIYQAADRIVEGGDWIVWQLTGELTRNSCAAGYKATWNKSEGFPSPEFLSLLHPGLSDLYTHRMAGQIRVPGSPAGNLSAEWGRRLGLPCGIPVAAAIIDAHSAILGGGIARPAVMFMIMGTSTCHMLMSEREVLVQGISGVVEDGIVPGLFGYEAGQAAVGDTLAWFVENAVPPVYANEAAGRNESVHDFMSARASALRPGQSGLLALDWWNGNRSIPSDAGLSGMLVGYTLTTRPEDIYRALVESTAFGARIIAENFIRSGVPVDEIMAGGGLTKNRFLMQIYADVIGRDITVSVEAHASGLGAAILGAISAGKGQGGYSSHAEAAACVAAHSGKVYRPIPGNKRIYDTLYTEYKRLTRHFGHGENDVMKILRRLRE